MTSPATAPPESAQTTASNGCDAQTSSIEVSRNPLARTPPFSLGRRTARDASIDDYDRPCEEDRGASWFSRHGTRALERYSWLQAQSPHAALRRVVCTAHRAPGSKLALSLAGRSRLPKQLRETPAPLALGFARSAALLIRGSWISRAS